MNATISMQTIYQAASVAADRDRGAARARRIASAIAPRGERGRTADAIREIWRKTAARAEASKPAPTVREWINARREARYAEILRAHGPVQETDKTGAGEFSIRALVGWVSVGSRTTATYGDQSSVARAYGYRVKDHVLEYWIPREMEVRLVAGVPTVGKRAAFRDRATPQRVAWFERSRGLNVKTIHGWLVRGYHVQAATAEKAAAKVEKIRCAAAADLAAKRHDAAGLAETWISAERLRAAGACPAGIDAARRAAERALEADGEIGAVRGDVAARIFAADPARLVYVLRCAGRTA